jgi:hypothetical protein
MSGTSSRSMVDRSMVARSKQNSKPPMIITRIDELCGHLSAGHGQHGGSARSAHGAVQPAASHTPCSCCHTAPCCSTPWTDPQRWD